MKVLIFGINGMLGHVLWQDFQKEFEVFGTVREGRSEEGRILEWVNAASGEGIDSAFKEARPETVINCIGIIKQIKEAHDPILSIKVNSLFPHILAGKCKETGCRLIHVSTDCVFSGNKGNYSEDDMPDPADLYGRSKLLGEVDRDNALTLRTSLIGRELKSRNGLLEWFLAQTGSTKGYRKAIFSGLTTYSFARVLRAIITSQPDLHGIYHIASEPINKYDLLCRFRDAFNKTVDIIPDDSLMLDRSLDPGKFKRDANIEIPSWDKMIEELKKRSKIL